MLYLVGDKYNLFLLHDQLAGEYSKTILDSYMPWN